MVFNVQQAIFQLYSGRPIFKCFKGVCVCDSCLRLNEQFFSYIVPRTWVIFYEIMKMSVLYLTNTLRWMLIVPIHRKNNPQVDHSMWKLYSDWNPTSLYSYSLNVVSLSNVAANTSFSVSNFSYSVNIFFSSILHYQCYVISFLASFIWIWNQSILL